MWMWSKSLKVLNELTLSTNCSWFLTKRGVSVTWNYCHDLEVMSSNPGRVELGVRNTSVLSHTWTKKNRTESLITSPWNIRFLKLYKNCMNYYSVCQACDLNKLTIVVLKSIKIVLLTVKCLKKSSSIQTVYLLLTWSYTFHGWLQRCRLERLLTQVHGEDMWNTQCPACVLHPKTVHQVLALQYPGQCTCWPLCWFLFVVCLWFLFSWASWVVPSWRLCLVLPKT